MFRLNVSLQIEAASEGAITVGTREWLHAQVGEQVALKIRQSGIRLGAVSTEEYPMRLSGVTVQKFLGIMRKRVLDSG